MRITPHHSERHPTPFFIITLETFLHPQCYWGPYESVELLLVLDQLSLLYLMGVSRSNDGKLLIVFHHEGRLGYFIMFIHMIKQIKLVIPFEYQRLTDFYR